MGEDLGDGKLVQEIEGIRTTMNIDSSIVLHNFPLAPVMQTCKPFMWVEQAT